MGKKFLGSITLVIFFACLPGPLHAAGITWPPNQLLPTFATPAPVLDCIDVSSASGAEIDLFASLEGIVNRSQPQVACTTTADAEGEFTWLSLHNLPFSLVSGYDCILKYRTNFTGLVVTDTNQPDTLNLATTMAGVNNELICAPALLPTLTNSPYNLPIVDDLRGKFSDKYAVYTYLYTNYWPLCTHRVIAGMETNLDGNLRDYLVAVKSATVWLDPGISQDAALLRLFVSNMTPVNGVYLGWWPSENNGLTWIAAYGIPVVASDFFRNGSVFGGVTHVVNVPDIPPPPPLENKIYVGLILSDGDNVQYMQHAMVINWENSARGSVPIGWTTDPLALDMDPVMFYHYWGTATTNDCLISGPSGAGYGHVELWSAANLATFARVSAGYLQRSGLRIITIWDQVNTGIATSYALNCPSLLGLTDQGGTYSAVNHGLRTIKLTPTYASLSSQMISGITNAAAGWNGTAPLFILAQATVWSIGPADLLAIANTFDTNKFKFIRPDHLFLLANQVYGAPTAVTQPATGITSTGATLQGTVAGNAVNSTAWFEWGTNGNYGSLSALANVGSLPTTVMTAGIAGLTAPQVYHYRLVASNYLGVARGADQIFTTGGRLKAWGGDSLGETNVPPGLTNIVGIAAGASHALALKNDGAVVAWGDNTFGQTNVPVALGNVVAVAAGIQHSLALMANGTVAAWGDNSCGQTNVPPGLTNVIAIAAGGYHNLALNADHTVTAWGYDNAGQTAVPPNLTNVVAVAAGGYHSLALKSDQTVVAWGDNSFGQTNVPISLNNVVALTAGQYHSLVLKANAAYSTNFSPTCKWIADSLVGAGGSVVSSWTDSIGGKNATQSAASQSPRLYLNGINGHKTVRFSGGSSQYLTVSAIDSPLSSAGSFTLVVVFKTSTPGNSSSLFYQNTGLLGAEQPNIVHDWAFCLNGSQLGAGLGAGTGNCGADFGLYGGNVTDGNPHIGMLVHTGDAITLFVDGHVVATQNSLCPMERGDYPFQIGAMTTGSYFYNGDIAEIQIYNRALNSWEIMSANESLAATYGIGGTAGTVVGWGDSAGGQAQSPNSLTNVLDLAGGAAQNLALNMDGSVTAWENNSFGQTNVPSGLTNVAAIAVGTTFSLAIGDQPPVAANTAFSGYVNHDLLLALPAQDPDGTSLTFQVSSLPPAGALYQVSGGSRGAAITAPGTAVQDPSGQLIFAPGANGTGSPYATFNFSCTDGLYTSGPAIATINIHLPSAPQFTGATWNPRTVPTFNLNFSGDSNATYSVWASTNLFNWQNLGPATESAPGRYQFTDSAVTDLPQRFYRFSAP
jgi:prepilin-type processing-associated H-X9-DG protein